MNRPGREGMAEFRGAPGGYVVLERKRVVTDRLTRTILIELHHLLIPEQS